MPDQNMPDQFDRAKAALADRYTIEREIGSGGFTTAKAAARLFVAEATVSVSLLTGAEPRVYSW